MITNLAIDAKLDEFARADWQFEQTPDLPASAQDSSLRVHIDLQIGPLFITIGEDFAHGQSPQIQQNKETA
jgi:hypothetical protein